MRGRGGPLGTLCGLCVSVVNQRVMSASRRPEVTEFLTHLDKERGQSPHTVKAYGRDLEAFTEFCDRHYGRWGWETVDRLGLRGFLGELQRRGLSKRSAARALFAAALGAVPALFLAPLPALAAETALDAFARRLDAGRPGTTLVALDWGFHEPVSFLTSRTVSLEPIWTIPRPSTRRSPAPTRPTASRSTGPTSPPRRSSPRRRRWRRRRSARLSST